MRKTQHVYMNPVFSSTNHHRSRVGLADCNAPSFSVHVTDELFSFYALRWCDLGIYVIPHLMCIIFRACYVYITCICIVVGRGVGEHQITSANLKCIIASLQSVAYTRVGFCRIWIINNKQTVGARTKTNKPINKSSTRHLNEREASFTYVNINKQFK